jgi:RNA polymerase sigma-70 factor (ECF subfamily)
MLAWYYKRLRKLNDPANFKAWAYGIATNKSIDWLRKTKAVKHISIEEIEEQQHKEKKDSGIKELMGKIEIRKRAVLSLYYVEQLSITEISVALRIPQGTVKSRLHNARKELKELWQKHHKP